MSMSKILVVLSIICGSLHQIGAGLLGETNPGNVDAHLSFVKVEGKIAQNEIGRA